MNRNLLLGIITVSAVALGSACTITESSTGSGGSSSVSNSSSSGDGGSGAQGGAVGSGGSGEGGEGGAGGGATCATCADYVFGSATEEELCASSIAKVEALGLCTCGDGMGSNGMCAAQCELTCTGQGENMTTCQACVGASCTAELGDCTSDLGE